MATAIDFDSRLKTTCASQCDTTQTAGLDRTFSDQIFQAQRRVIRSITMTKYAGHSFPLPPFENLRVRNLRGLGLLDTGPDPALDELVRIAQYVAQMPIAALSLVDRDRQWFKSKVGLDVDETPRDISFCTYTILQPSEPLIIADATQSEIFKANPIVIDGPKIRSYIGYPITSPRHDFVIGSLCVIDTVARHLSQEQLNLLREISISANRIIAARCKAA